MTFGVSAAVMLLFMLSTMAFSVSSLVKFTVVQSGTTLIVKNVSGEIETPAQEQSGYRAYRLITGRTYTLTVSHADYATFEKSFTVESGTNYTVDVEKQTLTTVTSDEDKVSNDDVLVTINEKKAIVLEGNTPAAQGNPGERVSITLPLAINKEYLPTERYVLRNITVEPKIPTTIKDIESWPFVIENVSYLQQVPDLSYGGYYTMHYDFLISDSAAKGVYPLSFTVNATIWRYDSVNGTSITENVEITLTQYVTVLSDGSASGVSGTWASGAGALGVAAIREDGMEVAAPKGNAGERITLRLPLLNRG
jgi:hypothetical protein